VTAPRELIKQQTQAMLDLLERRYPGSAHELSVDPLAALTEGHDVAVRLVDESVTYPGEAGAACSVAGMYLDDQDPPLLAVAAAASTGRQAFTALHEFGHHLQQTEDALIDQLLLQPDGGVELEEAACDGFAAAVLLPDDLVGAYIDGNGPTGPGIVDLWKASSASRAAVCVRAAQHLPTRGHVVLLDPTGTVSFAASAGLPPVRRGSDQSEIGTVREALARQGRASGRARLRYRDGINGDQLYAQVVPMGGYLLLVAVTDTAPWESFSLPPKETGPQGADWLCPHSDCAHEFTAFQAPCPKCSHPHCPECERCACQSRVTERMCTGCFQVLPTAVFFNNSDKCDECR
jgi:hypothetical protein